MAYLSAELQNDGKQFPQQFLRILKFGLLARMLLGEECTSLMNDGDVRRGRHVLHELQQLRLVVGQAIHCNQHKTVKMTKGCTIVCSS